MVKRCHHSLQSVVVVGVRVKDNAKWWKKSDATHVPGRGGELDSMRVKYSESFAACIVPVQGTHRSYEVCGTLGGRMCSYAFCYVSKIYRRRWTSKASATK